jgi:hypothetical protein
MVWIHAHAIELFIIWYIFSAAVSSMPTPLPNERGYQWFYVMLHTLAGSIGRAGASLYPAMFAQSPLSTNANPAAPESEVQPVKTEPAVKAEAPPKSA